MSKSKIPLALVAALLVTGNLQLFGQTVPPATKEEEAKLIAVLKSDASQKEKVDACRQLAVIGTKDAVAPLAALLADEKLSHMARYALEPIPDPAVDEALRDALGKLKGRPLVGVIGSIGVRRDARAVGALTKMLRDADAEVAQAAARALGSIGNSAAAKALQGTLADAPAANQLALCEGLLRCAEALAAKGQRDQAIAIYDRLRGLKEPHQARTGGVRGAILTRGEDGVALLREHLRSDDYILFSAACQTALEMPDAQVTQALTAALEGLPADNQILVIQTLGKRGDAGASPALFAAARGGAKPIRIAAIRSLAGIRGARGTAADLEVLRASSSVLVDLLADTDREVSQAAQETLGALPCQAWYDHALKMLDSGEPGRQLTAIELIGRQRITAPTTIDKLLEVARDAEPRVRQVAIRMVGELGGPDQLPALLDLLMRLKESQDLNAAEQAFVGVLVKADNPQSHTERLTSLLTKATSAQKSSLFRLLATVGGYDALRAVCVWVGDSDAEVNTAAIRALCAWKDANAAPILLKLIEKSTNPNDKTLCLRGYIGLVRDESLSTDKKLAMCKEAAGLIQRDEEKKLLLGALGTVPATEALSMAMAHLSNPATKDEAAFAVVAISEKLVEQKPSEVTDALQKVMRATDNRDVTRRARAILNKARKAAGR
jgi:HEAT repeat protein